MSDESISAISNQLSAISHQKSGAELEASYGLLMADS
jgi:hypothetical protein